MQGGFLIFTNLYDSCDLSLVCRRDKGDEIMGIVNEARRRRRMEAERQQLENDQV